MLTTVIETIVKKLVENPKDVEVVEAQTDSGKSVIRVQVASQDMGRVIGSEGRVLKSLKTIVQLMSSNQKDLIVSALEK